MDENAIKTYQGENAEELIEVETAVENPPVVTGDQPAEHWQDINGTISPETLPAEVRDSMPEDAQALFIAAYRTHLRS